MSDRTHDGAGEDSPMPDRTQTLTVEPVVREAMVLGFCMGALVRPSEDEYPKDSAVVDSVLRAAESHSDLYPNLNALSQLEPQGEEKGAQEIAWEESGRSALDEMFETVSPRDGSDGDPFTAAMLAPHAWAEIKRLRSAQPPAPVLSEEEREQSEQVAQKIEEAMADYGAGFSLADATTVRNLASQEHRGEEKMPYVCAECDHSIAPGASHGRDCSRHPSNLPPLPDPSPGEVGRLRERLLSGEAIQAGTKLLAHMTETTGTHFHYRNAHEFKQCVEATLDAAFPPPSDSQGDQERCGGSGLNPSHPTLSEDCPGCPDCNPAPTQVEGETVYRCDSCGHVVGRAGPLFDQPEPGDEEDWKPLWIKRPTSVADAENYSVWGPADNPEIVPHLNEGETRRYLPAASQDSSGLEGQK